MKPILGLLLVAASYHAFAADAPLFESSNPQWRYEDSALSDRFKVAPGAKKVIPLVLNRAAFKGDTIAVSVNNKTYTFVGKPTWHEATQGTTWSGNVAGSVFNRLSISVNDGPEGGVFGYLDVDGLNVVERGPRGPGRELEDTPPPPHKASKP